MTHESESETRKRRTPAGRADTDTAIEIQESSSTPFIQTMIRKYLRSCNLLLKLIDNAGICERREVAELITLACDDLAHYTTHNLARTRFGQVGHEIDLLRRRERTNDLTHLERELLVEASLVGSVKFELSERKIIMRQGRSLR